MASAKEMGCTIKLLCIAERGPDSTGAESVSVRVHPAMIPRTPPAGQRRRRLQRGLRRGRGGRAADVLRPRRRRRADRERGARRHRRGGPQPARRGPRGQRVAPTRTCRSGRSARRSPATTSASTWPTGRACWPPWPGSSPGTRCRIATVRQSGRARRTPTLVIVTHGAPDAALAATVEELRGLDIVRSIASVLRVEGDAEHDADASRRWYG